MAPFLTIIWHVFVYENGSVRNSIEKIFAQLHTASGDPIFLTSAV